MQSLQLLVFWGKSNINSVATEISNTAVKNVTILINPALYGLSERERFLHSAKRFGKYNEIPPGEYFLVPGLAVQKYMVYVIDSESKSASDENGIDGPDGSRGDVALHHYCPRFSVGFFTFNSGKNTQPVKDFVNEIPDLKLRDNRPVHFILEPREVVEITWENSAYGTKKWKGI